MRVSLRKVFDQANYIMLLFWDPKISGSYLFLLLDFLKKKKCTCSEVKVFAKFS